MPSIVKNGLVPLEVRPVPVSRVSVLSLVSVYRIRGQVKK